MRVSSLSTWSRVWVGLSDRPVRIISENVTQCISHIVTTGTVKNSLFGKASVGMIT